MIATISFSTVSTVRNDTNEYLGFLDYPHAHDPTHVSHVAALPTDLLGQLPSELQNLLWGLQESTSIVYASNERLQDLVQEKFDRLYLSTGSEDCKQHSFPPSPDDHISDNPCRLRDRIQQLRQPALRRTRLLLRRSLSRLEAQSLEHQTGAILRLEHYFQRETDHYPRVVY